MPHQPYNGKRERKEYLLIFPLSSNYIIGELEEKSESRTRIHLMTDENNGNNERSNSKCLVRFMQLVRPLCQWSGKSHCQKINFKHADCEYTINSER